MRAQYVQYVGPWGQAWPVRTLRRPRGVRVSLGAHEQRQRGRGAGEEEREVEAVHRPVVGGPLVGPRHQHRVERVDERHARGEEERQHEDARARRLGLAEGGEREQPDLGRRVEAQAEEQPDAGHLPRPVDGRDQRGAARAHHRGDLVLVAPRL